MTFFFSHFSWDSLLQLKALSVTEMLILMVKKYRLFSQVTQLARYECCEYTTRSRLLSFFAEDCIASLPCHKDVWLYIDKHWNLGHRAVHGENILFLALLWYSLFWVKDHFSCSAEQNNSGSLCNYSSFSWNWWLMKKSTPILFGTKL